MPPALSDYDSDSENVTDFYSSETELKSHPEASTRVSLPGNEKPARVSHPDSQAITHESNSPVEPPVEERKRKLTHKKRSLLLAGLDHSNIIKDGSASSSAVMSTLAKSPLRSSQRSRIPRRITSTLKSELCYDQKYHPLDDYLRPKQASKLRHAYGEVSSTREDPEEEHNTQKCSKGKGKSKFRSAIPIPIARFRRSSRQASREVLYNMQVHPQDEELAALEEEEDEGDDVESRDRKRTKQADEGEEEDTENVLEDEGDVEGLYASDATIEDSETPTLVSDDEESVESLPSTGDRPDQSVLERDVPLRISIHSVLETRRSGSVSSSISGVTLVNTPLHRVTHTSPRRAAHTPSRRHMYRGGYISRYSVNRSYPTVAGEPFSILQDREQRHEALLSLSPVEEILSDDDNKENVDVRLGLEQAPDLSDGVTVRHISTFRPRQQEHDNGGGSNYYDEFNSLVDYGRVDDAAENDLLGALAALRANHQI